MTKAKKAKKAGLKKVTRADLKKVKGGAKAVTRPTAKDTLGS